LKKEIKGYIRIIYATVILFSTILTAHAQTPNCSAASKFYSKDSINIVTFGASTVAGIGGFSLQPDLKTNFENCYVGKTIDITDNGVPGETTSQGLVRFPAAIAGRTGFIFIDMGANDAQAIVNKKMTISTTEKNMRYYIEEAQKHNLIVIIGTIQFYNDNNDQFLKDCNLVVKQINLLYKRLAADYHIYVADINASLGRDFSLYQDYVHPNAAGYKLLSFVLFDTINEAIEDKLLLIAIGQNYPNPMQGTGNVDFSLSQAGHVLITLYNMQGKPVRILEDAYQDAGYHTLSLNLNDLSAGMYIYSMQVGGQQLSKKLLLVK